MKRIAPILIVLSLILSSCQNEVKREAIEKSNSVREISFYTPDSIKIFGDLYEFDKKNSTILLFHQGGSNSRGEYASIIPKLIELEYNILAIDQRKGGQVYGNYNRTLANIPTNRFGDGYGYCDAYNNLESALDFVNDSGFTGDKILWGSSYSAALAIKLAHNKQEEIKGVLAFSPATGNPLKDCRPEAYFETLEVPLLLLRPPSEMENENAITQFELAKKFNHQTYVAKYGVHGSSMLDSTRVKNDVRETWNIVLSFLSDIETR